MTRYLFCLLAIFCSITLQAQNLSFDELVDLKQKNIVELEELLSAKNWELLQASYNKGGTFRIVTFTYKKNKLIDNAESFLHYAYAVQPEDNTISIQINKQDIYQQYMAALKARGVRLLESNVKHNMIQKIYQDATYTYIVGTHAIKDEIGTYTTYNFLIISNKNFNTDIDLLDAAVEE